MNAAEILRSARARARLTQRELADRTGIAQPMIAAIEAGKQDPRFKTLDRLTRACGYDLDLFRHPGEGVDRTTFTLSATPAQRLRHVDEMARNVRWLASLRRVKGSPR